MIKRLLLLFLLSLTTIVYAQQKQVIQHIVRVGDKIYIKDQDDLFEVNKRIVTVKPKSSDVIMQMSLQVHSINKLGYSHIFVPDDIDVIDFVESLKRTGAFETIEYNGYAKFCLTPDDSNLNNQWYLDAINAYGAWDITTGNSSIKVAILDSGVDAGHPDLGFGNENYSHVDTTNGWDYLHNTNYQQPTYDHGTLVAGVTGAKTNNSLGIAGISGGNHTKGVSIIPFCISNAHQFLYFIDFAQAITDAVDNGSKVINMSFVCPESVSMNSAIEYAYLHGVTVICSAGNNTHGYISYPASHDKTIAVGATDINNTRANFSQYGNKLDLVAPGVDIFSTTLNNNYKTVSGTSFSAPQVTGTIALMLSLNPSLSPAEIYTALISTCQKLPNYNYNSQGWNNETGYGLLDVNAAVRIINQQTKIQGSSTLCNPAVYKIPTTIESDSVTWSIDNSDFLLTPLGYQCRVASIGMPHYSVASLTATLYLNGVAVDSFSKRIVMHSEDLYVDGEQLDEVTPSGVLSGFTFTIPEGNRQSSEIPLSLQTLSDMETLAVRDSLRRARIDTLIIHPNPLEPHDPGEPGPMNPYPIDWDDDPEFGFTEINGDANIFLTSDRFDGMNISFSGDHLPVSYSHLGTDVLFRMPPASSVIDDDGEYYVRLRASSTGGCHDFDLYFRVIPIEGEAYGDSEIYLRINGNSLEVSFFDNSVLLPNGQVQIFPWYLNIYEVSTGTRVHASTNTQNYKTINTSGWNSGIYLVRVTCNGNNYNKKFVIQ